MEVRKGYKQTEVGVIPEDWQASPLPDVVWFQEGPGLRKWQFKSSGLKVINVTNLQENGYLDLGKTERYISWEEFERTYKHFLIDDGDVVVASSGNSYCKTAVVRQNDLPLLMNTSVIRFKAKEGIGRSYMLIYLKSAYFKDQIDLMITGGAQPNFGPAHLNKVFIPLPPTKAEQEAIAEALSDADALIESLTQLIDKKRQIKQGAMQELLTGKRRLPGFVPANSGYKQTEVGVIPEDWEIRPASTFGHIVKGGTPPTTKSEYWHGEYPWVTPSDISSQRDIFTSERCISFSGLKVLRTLPANTVLVTCIASIGKNAILRHLGACNQQINAVISNENHLAEFLYYLFENSKSYLLANAGITATSIVSKAVFNKLPYALPPSKAEQEAIAEILGEMDAELAALEAKLTKARALKQGMMHELLTGRIRLV